MTATIHEELVNAVPPPSGGAASAVATARLALALVLGLRLALSPFAAAVGQPDALWRPRGIGHVFASPPPVGLVLGIQVAGVVGAVLYLWRRRLGPLVLAWACLLLLAALRTSLGKILHNDVLLLMAAAPLLLAGRVPSEGLAPRKRRPRSSEEPAPRKRRPRSSESPSTSFLTSLAPQRSQGPGGDATAPQREPGRQGRGTSSSEEPAASFLTGLAPQRRSRVAGGVVAPLRGWGGSSAGAGAGEAAARTGVAAAAAIVLLAYFSAGWWKLLRSGPAWALSDNLQWSLAAGRGGARWPALTGWLVAHPAACVGLACAILALEVGAPLLWLRPRAAPWFVAAAAVMHGGTWLVMGLDYWAHLAAVALVLLPWARMRRR